ncbi:TauD-domain-containing protein [Macroventuria anomochaeta]|uniref:TauD-domain-containing protein n=1 Tax=Macroventuria anomochaeta TaxID=301207 RepID=A0ACB6RP67_9PLEO|nr:TauD-domain-containing protein [Macroventuria anomochaeta]KAF2623533.1 TauD-domain-containing protein [Macroventuria anomochaeta]
MHGYGGCRRRSTFQNFQGWKTAACSADCSTESGHIQGSRPSVSTVATLEWGSFFGRHRVPPTSGTPEGFPEIQIAHRGAGDDGFEQFFKYNTTSAAWRSDASFEAQPPGITIMFMLETPACGGDTIFSNQVEAYRRLSPAMQKCLHGLKALHSVHFV